MKRVGRAAIIMSAVPAVFEIFGVMLVAPKLLHITYLEAAILGSILAAVSPAVVVPLMIDFMDRGRGSQKGIPTLILGASSLDDVFAIAILTFYEIVKFCLVKKTDLQNTKLRRECIYGV